MWLEKARQIIYAKRKTVLIFVGLLLLVTAYITHPLFYVGQQITGVVLDEETGEPLPGVVVVAMWVLEGSDLGGSAPVGIAEVTEAVTDERGRYEIPGWGPLWFPKGRLGRHSPELVFFKVGYSVINRVDENPDRGVFVSSDWDDKTTSLPKYELPSIWKGVRSNIDGYVIHLQQLNTIFSPLLSYRFLLCGWKKIPRLLLETGKIEDLLRQEAGSGGVLSIYSIVNTNDEFLCGSVAGFYREHLGIIVQGLD